MRKLKNFYSFLRYDIPRGMGNIVRWVPIIWNDRDWDWAYLAIVMEYKLRRMSENFSQGHHVGSAKDARQCLVAAELLRRLNEDNYYLQPYTRNTKYDYLRGDATAKNDQQYLGLLIGKYLRQWWD